MYVTQYSFYKYAFLRYEIKKEKENLDVNKE